MEFPITSQPPENTSLLHVLHIPTSELPLPQCEMEFAKCNHEGQGKKRCTSIPRIRSRTHEVGYPYSYPVVCTVVSEHLSNPKPYTLSAHPRVFCNKTGHHKPLNPCIINTDFSLVQSHETTTLKECQPNIGLQF